MDPGEYLENEFRCSEGRSTLSTEAHNDGEYLNSGVSIVGMSHPEHPYVLETWNLVEHSRVFY